MPAKKIRILVNCPNAKDATSFYRGIGPLTHLVRACPEIELHFAGEYNWATLALGDILFMQRPYTRAHVQIIEMAKANGKRVWVDLDDDLFNVPESNPAHEIYGPMDTKKNVASCLAHADVVTVSTEHLKRQIQGGSDKDAVSLNANVLVVPNALHDGLLGYRNPPEAERHPLSMWRGSKTHQKDLSDFLPEIIALVNVNPKWTFTFQGDKPWFLFERLNDNAIFAPAIDPVEYFEFIHRTRPQAFFVPLSNHVFNKSKSNIAWIEGVFAGAVTIAPDWEEWRVPGCLNYRSAKEFLSLNQAVVNGEVDVNRENAVAWEFVKSELTLTRVNHLRRKVVLDLYG